MEMLAVIITAYGLLAYALGIFVGWKAAKLSAQIKEAKITVRDLRPRD